jgi:hypothetical protein
MVFVGAWLWFSVKQWGCALVLKFGLPTIENNEWLKVM